MIFGRGPKDPVAAMDCPRPLCPSDAATYEMVKTAGGITIATIYTCRVCAIAWDDSGYIENPEELRP